MLGIVDDINDVTVEEIQALAKAAAALPPSYFRALLNAVKGIQMKPSSALPNAQALKAVLDTLAKQTFPEQTDLAVAVADFLQHQWPRTHVITTKKVDSFLMDVVQALKTIVSEYSVNDKLTEWSQIPGVTLVGGSLLEKARTLLALLEPDNVDLDRVLALLPDLEKEIESVLAFPLVMTALKTVLPPPAESEENTDLARFFKTKQLRWLMKIPLEARSASLLNDKLATLYLDQSFLPAYLTQQLEALRIDLPWRSLDGLAHGAVRDAEPARRSRPQGRSAPGVVVLEGRTLGPLEVLRPPGQDEGRGGR